MSIWTKEYRRAYMREYYGKNRDWIRVTFALWYQKNGAERNRRRRQANHRNCTRPQAGRAPAQALDRGCLPDVPSVKRGATQSGKQKG